MKRRESLPLLGKNYKTIKAAHDPSNKVPKTTDVVKILKVVTKNTEREEIKYLK